MMKKETFIKNEEGAALVEAVLFILFILLPTFLGLVELSSYIRTKEHVNRVAHEMGELFSSIPEWDQTEANSLRVAATLIARPHGMRVDAIFCEGGGLSGGNQDVAPIVIGGGLCGYGSNRAEGTALDVTNASCDNSGIPRGDSGAGGTSAAQYVVVEASCHYSPMLRVFDFFVGDSITASTVSPMRNVVNFNN